MAKSMNKLEEEEEEQSSKRHFHWTTRVSSSNNEDEATAAATFNTITHQAKDDDDDEDESSSSSSAAAKPPPSTKEKESEREEPITKSKKQHAAVAVSRLRSLFGKINLQQKRVVLVGTLFGNKSGGHVHYFAIQKDPKLEPALLIQLPTPITGLVREMASGLVRIVLESEKKGNMKKKKKKKGSLLEEPVWRAYCNGMKCGVATRMECGADEWKILKAVEHISMGAGFLPSSDGTMMMIYMRAKFERVVGSTDSEAYYMLNPDNNNNNKNNLLNSASPELTIYLLRL